MERKRIEGKGVMKMRGVSLEGGMIERGRGGRKKESC
jgi:hypothetical protein